MFLDPQSIVFQLSIPSCPYIQVGHKKGGRKYDNCLQIQKQPSRDVQSEVLHEKYLF